MTASALVVHHEGVRVTPEQARRALQGVLGSPVAEASVRLRHHPHSCLPLARLIDGSTVADDLVIAAASVGTGMEVVRVRRKAHGIADWITSPTNDITLTFGPAPIEGEVAVLPDREPEPQLPGIWERGLTGTDAVVLDRLYDVLDPDLGINIVDFGFVRDISVEPTDAGGAQSEDHQTATITMTLTSPTCPVTGVMVDQIRTALVSEDDRVVDDVSIVWSWIPAWRPRDLSPDGVDQLRAIGFNPLEAS